MLLVEIPGGYQCDLTRATGTSEIVYANMGCCASSVWELGAVSGADGRLVGAWLAGTWNEVEESIWRQIAGSQYDLDYVDV